MLVLRYPVVAVGVMQFGGIEQETPTVDGEEAQRVPPEVQVQGLFPVHVAILVPGSEMSMAV